jgi:hypothetical protein
LASRYSVTPSMEMTLTGDSARAVNPTASTQTTAKNRRIVETLEVRKTGRKNPGKHPTATFVQLVLAGDPNFGEPEDKLFFEVLVLLAGLRPGSRRAILEILKVNSCEFARPLFARLGPG